MREKFVGLYWTLPVSWAGFQSLSDSPFKAGDVDTAARKSETILYQRDLVRRWVHENRGDLIHERAFLEKSPDRGSDEIHSVVGKLAELCRREDARLLIVDFSENYGMRSHSELNYCIEQDLGERHLKVPAEPLTIEVDSGPPQQLKYFDPVEHFRAWRKHSEEWSSAKSERAREALNHIEQWRSQKLSFANIAGRLNDAGLKTLTGRVWTADNVRKMLNQLS
jgi:hypothetical protein